MSAEARGSAVRALGQDLATVGDARRFVGEKLAEWQLADLRDVAYLVVSELAANAITHAESDYEVTVTATDGGVRVAVTDHGPGFPAAGPAQLVSEHGRGLLLVAAMTADWGVEPTGDGKVVWAEIRGGD